LFWKAFHIEGNNDCAVGLTYGRVDTPHFYPAAPGVTLIYVNVTLIYVNVGAASARISRCCHGCRPPI
jgi:hypothetical protein